MEIVQAIVKSSGLF